MFPIPEFGPQTILAVGIFLGLLLAFEGLRQVLSRGRSTEGMRNRRMRMIAGGASPAEVLSLLKPDAGAWALHSLPLIGDLPQVIRRAALPVRPGAYLLALLGATALITLAGSLKVGFGMALAAGLLLGLVLPVLVVRHLANRRTEALTRQLPDALEIMARSLKVGHPINASITAVASDMADPIATEFGVVVDQIAYGDDLVAAMSDFATRVGTEDVRFLATSIAIQNGTGSDLARILLTLSKVIRGRMTMRRKILAISAEGRLTAVFLSLLPVLIIAETFITSPDYYPGVADDPMFKPLAYIVVGLIVGNYLIMRRLVNFRI